MYPLTKLTHILIISMGTPLILSSCHTLNPWSQKRPSPVTSSVNDQATPAFVFDCPAAREYITAHEYLRKEKKFQISEQEAQKIADQVARGCHGAAERFIKTADLLTTAQLPSQTALKTAIALAQAQPEIFKGFDTIFRKAYEPKSGLDLTVKDAYELATRLSLNLKGNAEQAAEDFVAIANYCLDVDGLNLPRPDCAQLAQFITEQSEKFLDVPLASSFIETMEYLREDDDGPKVTTGDAIKIARQLASVSPFAHRSFRTAFHYAQSKSGLKLARNDAIDFALNIAKYTSQQPKEHTQQTQSR